MRTDVFHNPAAARALAARVAAVQTRPWRIMEVCGGQTHALVRYGIDRLLPDDLTLLHGPGCPVCVTPAHVLDQAIDLARRPGVTLCSFGDMLRVPGRDSTLAQARSAGADIRVVYSPLDALALAAAHPEREVVFLGVGFETTAPGVALAIEQAHHRALPNFSVLISHVRVPPALSALLSTPDAPIDGFLAAGHVCAIMGTAEYAPIAARYRVPIVVTGFTPVDLLSGILACVEQLEAGRHEVENRYLRVAADHGNPAARAALLRVFEPIDQRWRGLGPIPASGLGLRPMFAHLDARLRFALPSQEQPADADAADPSGCQAGRVLLGQLPPPACPAFGTRCTPDHPLGPPMVSSEGACAAWYRYRGARP